jgi:hypothetical protein
MARASIAAMVIATGTSAARADEPPEAMPVAFGADQVRFDPRTRELDAQGRVQLDARPFYLTSDSLKLRRVGIGVELEGQGEASFCLCVDPPMSVRFRGATVAPPHDLVLYGPVLEVFGVPVAWAPAVWLRSPARFGLLPPELAWRGADGLLIGGGLHVPWRDGDAARGIDLRAGGYTEGGIRAAVDMRSAISETSVTWDHLHGDDGIVLDLRGSTATTSGTRPDSTAWEIDALRGGRAVKATTDLDMAARPFDRAQAQAAWRVGGWTFASGIRTVALRGGDLLDTGVGGPVVTARRAEAIERAGAYDAMVEGGSVGGPGVERASFARGETGGMVTARFGAAGATLSARFAGDIADEGTGVGVNGAAQSRAILALPFARAFASPDDADPWVHRVEPYLSLGAMAAHSSGILAVAAGRGTALPNGTRWVAVLGLDNALGRWGSRAAGEVEASGGVIGGELSRPPLPLLRARAALGGRWVGLRGELARVFALSNGDTSGGVLRVEGRIGPESLLHVSVHAAGRDGVDPLLARALVDAPLEPTSGFLVATGWTGGARLGVPIGSRVTMRAGAEFDRTAPYLVAALGALELHDACQCVVVRAAAAHRVGRDGVDVWLSVDLPGL